MVEERNRFYPVSVIDIENSDTPLNGIIQIGSGNGHNCALSENGRVKCWGQGAVGQLGHDEFSSQSYPVFVVSRQGSSAALSGISQLVVDNNRSCGITFEGELKCWGGGDYGGLGNNSDQNRDYPINPFVDGNQVDYLNVGTYQSSYSCLIGGSDCIFNNISLTLVGGISSPSSSSSVSIQVSGIGINEEVPLYRDELCISEEGRATRDNNTVSFSDLEEGVHRFLF